MCLSGGGFRAALFHLGALRRLNELGILSQVEAVSAVSGGSVVAAHLAERVRVWPARGEAIPDWEATVAAPFRAFASRNLRTGPLLRRAIPSNWLRSDAAIEAMVSRLQRTLVKLDLTELPDRPRYIFSATDMTFGVNWIFEKTRVGDFQAGYLVPAPGWPVARAVAASSCFPPVFGPMRLRLRPEELRGGRLRGAERDKLIAGLRLTDGGAYDNMGLEPVWKTYPKVLVSDGGAVFDYASSSNPIRRLLRYPAIVGKQAAAVRKRWLIASFAKGTLAGAFWSLASAPPPDEPGAHYSKYLIDELIVPIRTDLDAFSAAEIAVLENHGYLAAERTIRSWAPGLVTRDAPPIVPHPDWLKDEARIRDALRGSHARTLLGRH
ncbi:MAG: patatin-like phospholipase family protein [Thermomicrobiales bacterium]